MANKKISTLAAQFASQPVLVAEDMKDQFEALLHGAVEQEQWATLEAAAGSFLEDDFWDDDYEDFRPYEVNSDGILFIPVKGVLLHNFPYQFGNWATGYQYIEKAVMRGLEDMNVKGIALLCNSPGGMVAGCFETVDRIYARRGEKPIRAFAHEAAYSAAYAIASGADSIVVSRTGGVGSIGVVTSHIDLSKMYEQAGIKQTFIFAGKHKVDGNSSEPLSADAKERIQVRIDELYDVFVSSVARNRGMEEQAVRDTEALPHTATQVVSNGLADSIGPLDDAVAQFCVELSTPDTGDETMSENKDNTAVVEQAVHEKAVADARAEGFSEGEVAAKIRIGAILGSEEAKGREDLANHFAFKTGMSAEDALAALSVSPKAAAEGFGGNADAQSPEGEGGFEAAMEHGNPEVGASSQNDSKDENSVDAILALAGNLGLSFGKK